MIRPPHSDFLGKSISEVSNVRQIGTDPIYSFKGDDYSFLGFSHSSFVFSTDKVGLIESLRFTITQKMDKLLYNLMITEYGKPVQILIPEKFEFDPKSLRSGLGHAQMIDLKFRIGTFEDGPVLIVWQMDDYNIQVKLGTEQLPSPNTEMRFLKGTYVPVTVVNE